METTKTLENYEDQIREFLSKNMPKSGVINVDWSVWINIRTGEIFEHVEASSNWAFQYADEDRMRICQFSNYEKIYNDHTDLIAEGDDDLTCSNFSIDELPEDFGDWDWKEKSEWIELNYPDAVTEYNEHFRSEAIDSIIENIYEDDDNFTN